MRNRVVFEKMNESPEIVKKAQKSIFGASFPASQNSYRHKFDTAEPPTPLTIRSYMTSLVIVVPAVFEQSQETVICGKKGNQNVTNSFQKLFFESLKPTRKYERTLSKSRRF